jgi:hypothetical protein
MSSQHFDKVQNFFQKNRSLNRIANWLKIPWKFELCLMVYIKHGTGIAATPKA